MSRFRSSKHRHRLSLFGGGMMIDAIVEVCCFMLVFLICVIWRKLMLDFRSCDTDMDECMNTRPFCKMSQTHFQVQRTTFWLRAGGTALLTKHPSVNVSLLRRTV